MNRYTFTFYLLGGWKFPTVVTTKAKSVEEANDTFQRYLNGCFWGRVAPYSTRLRSVESVS